ncbi:MAG: GNAT family N-acetyltransferase [Chloroflexota bacterium]|nr:GNAT family N-acetyltransferase [Chloroflexota bacterium]
MKFDPVVSLRTINNERLRLSLGWGEYRDLGGALALTSDAALHDLNRIESFTTDERRLDGLLDIGFALLRAFDCAPAVCVTPLDRPATLPLCLAKRGLSLLETSVTMVFRGDADAIRTNPEVEVRHAAPDDAMAFRDVIAGPSNKWLRKLMLASTIESMQHAGHTFYIGSTDGQPAGTLHLLIDHQTAGLYAVHTSKSQRKAGVASTLLAAAIADAQAAGCDVIGLRTAADGDARRLFDALGFEVAHENQLWVMPEAPG